MIKQNKTKLKIIAGALMFFSFTLVACNNDGEKKETVKDEPAITTTPPTTVKDSTDTMEKIKGGVSPVVETPPK